MEILWQVLAYAIPAIIVLLVVAFLLKRFEKAQENRYRYLLYKDNQKVITPIRFTAYERLVLFLERISPESMLVRCQNDALTVIQLQSTLLTTIRAEYEHNVAQQVYVSEEAWEVVRNAKESIVQLVNACASHLEPQAPSIELSKAVLATYQQAPDSPTTVAIAFLKNELKKYFA